MTAAARMMNEEREPDEVQERQCSEPGCRVPSGMVRVRTDGQPWCMSHDPTPQGRALHALTQQRGTEAAAAKQRRRPHVLEPGELGALQSVRDAMRQLGTIATAVAEGRLTATQGNAATRAIQSWLRAFEAVQLERTLTEIVALVNGKMDGNDTATVRRIRDLIARAQATA